MWETIAHTCPEQPEQSHGSIVIRWRELDQGTNGIAAWLLRSGCKYQDKVALYLYNGPEYMQTAHACMKASLVPVNTNYRYKQNELRALWDNADVSVVVFDAAFTTTIEEIRTQCTKVHTWLHVGGANDGPEWAAPYASAAKAQLTAPVTAWLRSDDDLILIYTGGTTGQENQGGDGAPAACRWRTPSPSKPSARRRTPSWTMPGKVRAPSWKSVPPVFTGRGKSA